MAIFGAAILETKNPIVSGGTRAWRGVLLASAILLVLGVALRMHAYPLVEREEIQGSYVPGAPAFLASATDPARIDLEAGGRIHVVARSGAVTSGTWSWDGPEGWVRSDVPELDHRIRGFSGWTGLVLLWRSNESLDDTEELELVRQVP